MREAADQARNIQYTWDMSLCTCEGFRYLGRDLLLVEMRVSSLSALFTVFLTFTPAQKQLLLQYRLVWNSESTLYCKIHTTTQALCSITLEQGWCPFFSLVSHNYQKKKSPLYTHRWQKPQSGLRSVLCPRNSNTGFWCAELSVCTRSGGQHKLSTSFETFSSVGKSKGSLDWERKNGEKRQIFSPVLGMSTCQRWAARFHPLVQGCFRILSSDCLTRPSHAGENSTCCCR